MDAHLRTRNHPSFARLCRETPMLAIYDDHDFGPNDADGNFEGRDLALSSFTRMWAQALYGTEAIPGIFSSLRLGPLELFLTDGRYHRNVSGDTVLGGEQLAWLLNGLRKSTAPVKLVASGTTVLAHHPFYHDWESWHRSAPDDLELLLSTIEREDLRLDAAILDHRLPDGDSLDLVVALDRAQVVVSCGGGAAGALRVDSFVFLFHRIFTI